MEQALAADWVVDASGRAGLLRQQLELKVDNGHRVNAAWFRLSTRVEIDDWSGDESWQARCYARERWLSTNHLVGPGYWVWLIPLSSGSHSIGIVADEDLHPLRSYNSFERAVAWLRTHQPRLRGNRRRRARQAAGLHRPAALLLWLQARVLAAPLGAHG